jgi:hypothetical protein
MDTGSFVNHLIGGGKQRDPEVGMPATICQWTDRSPATVVEVLRFKTGPKAGQLKGVVVTADEYKVVKGSMHDGSAQYEYTPQPDSPNRATFLIDQHGRYVRKGGGDKLSLGHREAYRDPSF